MGLSGREFAERLFQAKKVLVTPGDPFGPSGPGYVRLSYAVEDGRLREGLCRMAEFLQEGQMRAASPVRRQPEPAKLSVGPTRSGSFRRFDQSAEIIEAASCVERMVESFQQFEWRTLFDGGQEPGAFRPEL